MEGVYFSNTIVLMKSNDHLIEQLSDLGIFLTPKEMNWVRKAVMLDRKIDRKLKKRARKRKMISEHRQIKD